MHADESPDRSGMLWRTLAGLFGADSLERKFGKTPPREWVGLLRTLNDFELQRGLKRLAYCGKGHVPTLPEFLRMAREVGSDIDDNQPRIPQSHRLEARADLRWEREGDTHLRSYLHTQGALGIHYCSDRMRRFPVPRETDHESIALIKPLLEAKAAWAEDMRDAEMSGKLPAENGKAEWLACVRNAEAVIALVRQDQAA